MNTPSIKHLLPLGAYCCATSALATGTKGWKLANKMAKTVSYLPCEAGKATRASTSSRSGIASEGHWKRP